MNKEELRKVLFTEGMTGSALLVVTNAPKAAIEEYCKLYINNKGNLLELLEKNYDVHICFDLEEHTGYKYVEAIGYDELYDTYNYATKQ